MKRDSQNYEKQELEYLRQNLESLSDNLSPVDPQARLVMEAVALQVARLRHRFDSGWAVTRQTLGEALFPFPWGIVPTLQLLQFIPGDEAVAGDPIKAGSPLRPTGGPEDGGDRTRLRTVEPVVVYPIRLANAACNDCELAFDLEISANDPSATFSTLSGFDKIRLYLTGPHELTFSLHEALATARSCTVATDGSTPHGLRVAAGGFQEADQVIPAMPRLLPGERLLSEFMLYPARFLCLDLAGFGAVCASAGRTLRVTATFAHKWGGLKGRVSDALLVVNGVPGIDSHRGTTPVAFSPYRAENRVDPDARHSGTQEVVGIQEVRMSGRVIPPLFEVKHFNGVGSDWSWRCARRKSGGDGDIRSEVSLALVEVGATSRPLDDCTLNATITYCGGDGIAQSRLPRWKLVEGSLAATAVASPTAPLRSGSGPAHELPPPASPPLSLRGLGLVPREAGGTLMRDFLSTRALLDWEPSPGLAALARDRVRLVSNMIRGVKGATIQTTTAAPKSRAVVLTVDPSDFPGGSTYLFGRVLALLVSELATPLVTSSLRLEAVDGTQLGVYGVPERSS